MVDLTGGGGLSAYLRDKAIKYGNAKAVKVGFLGTAQEADGTPVAVVAAIQNFGDPAHNIPPRPFFNDMVSAHKNEWGPELAKTLAYTGNASDALAMMGERMAGQLIESIDATNSPPLSPKTVKRKGFDKPLIDSGVMRASLQGSGGYEVV